MPKTKPVTREQCAEIFKYLEETERGKKIIQDQLDAKQQRQGKKVLIKGTANSSRKFTVTKPDEKRDKFKMEIFYHYMQNKSRQAITEAMMDVPGFDLLNLRGRTFDDVINGWGYPLNQAAHKAFIANMRNLPLNDFHQEDGIGVHDEKEDVDAECEIDDGYNSVPAGNDDEGESYKALPEETSIENQIFTYLGSLAAETPVQDKPFSSVRHQTTKMPMRLNSSLGSISSEITSTKRSNPSAHTHDQPRLQEISHWFEYQHPSRPLRDSGYESMRNSIASSTDGGKLVPWQSSGLSAQSRPGSSSQSSNTSFTAHTNPRISTASTPNSTTASSATAKPFRIFCNSIHNSSRFIADRHFVCPRCGLAYVHSVALHHHNLAATDLSAFQFRYLDINKKDRAGNTVLHYASANGLTNDMLLQLRTAGVDFSATNTSEQTWLHCLNTTRLGEGLLNLLKNSTSQQALTHRDVYGVTILMRLLEAPLKQALCRKLIELFPPSIFTVQDNLGRTASSILRNTYRRHSLTLCEPRGELSQTINILQGHADIFGLAPIGNNNPDERRLQVIRGEKPIDVDGSNALQCLAYWPPGHTEYDENQRYLHIGEILRNQVDLHNYDNNGNTPIISHIKSVEPTRDDSTTARIVDSMISSSANFEFRDREGKTALYWACVGGLVGCVDVLLQHGARVNIRATLRENLTSEEEALKGVSLLQALMAQERAIAQQMQAGLMVGCNLLERLGIIIERLRYEGARLDPSMVDEWGL